MDRFSETGPCVKNFSDADFFVTQWLEAQTKKMEEEKRKRKARKADRVQYFCVCVSVCVCLYVKLRYTVVIFI